MTLDEKLVHDDAAARSAALDVSRSFIVQAPAGSGKTELLIQRYLRLLATVDDPEEVLAITFTRKAAAEMQLRVLSALRNVASGLVPHEAHERVTADAAAAVLRRDGKFSWNVIANPRRMRIQTLDALNAFIARSQPLTSTGGAAGSRIVADARMRSLYRNAATLTLDQLLETGSLHDATTQVLSHVDNNTALYVGYLARMLATRDQWLPFIGAGLVNPDEEQELRRRFESNLEEAVAGHLKNALAATPAHLRSSIVGLAAYAAEQLRNASALASPICELQGIVNVPDAVATSIPAWNGLAELLLTKQGSWRKTVTKAQGFPVGDDGQKQSMLELLGALLAEPAFRDRLHDVRTLPPVRYSDEQWQVLLALFRLLPLAVTELKRLFSEEGVTDYIDVALSASDALGTAEAPGDVALLLDYQLRHLLVDEMQDTSSAQYRMLEALTGGWQQGDGRTLFCVGDPMQSIYRFRNAEVGQFLLARSAGIGNVRLEPLTLRRNFRSGEYLVDWFNMVFPDVLAAEDKATESAVAYSAAVSVPRLEGQGKCVVHPLFGSDPGAEAETGCGVIRDVLEQNPEDEVAVLVRSRTSLPRLLSRLRSAGIAYRAVEIDRLTDLPEIIDVLAVTRALVHRSDRLAWLALLRSPWVGLDWHDLHALVKADTRAAVWELLHQEDRLARLSTFGQAAIRTFRETWGAEHWSGRLDSLRDRVERLWLALGGPAILNDCNAIENVYRYLDVLESLEVAGTLADVAELEDALDLVHVSSESDARLQVMTMHRSKGLQFDHVLLYGLGRSPGRHDRSVLSWFDIPAEHGVDEKVISPVGPRADIENDPVHRFIEKTEATKSQHELGRLLYVACTRARKSLQLLGHVEVSANGEELRPARAHSLLSLLWPSVAEDYQRAFSPGAGAAREMDEDRWLLPELRRFKTPWALPDVGPVPGAAETPLSESDDQPVEFYWVGTGARVAGTLVHRWLQLATDRRIELGGDESKERRAANEHWLREAGISSQSFDLVIERVEQSLRGILDDPRGRWLLDGDGHAELPLTGVYQGQVESVVLDRVRIDENDTHWIVDYKTSSHEGGNLDDFLQAEADRYRPQLQKYAGLYGNYSGATIRCALYFPLLQKFLEVET